MRWIGIIFFLLVLSIGIFREYVFFGRVMVPGNLLVSFYEPWASYAQKVPAKPIGFDTLRSFYPTRTLVVDQLKQGKLPLWNPYSFSGNNLLGVYQSAVFHPMSFLFFLLPQEDAWSVIILLTPVIAGVGMYWFLQAMQLGVVASVFGAVAWAFSGIMIVWWQEMFMATYSIISLPYVLVAIEKLRQLRPGVPFPESKQSKHQDSGNGTVRMYFLILVLGLVWSILSGWFQNTLYLFVFSFAWAIFRGLKLRIVWAYIVAMLVSAIQWVPAAEAYLNSARGGTDVGEMFTEMFVSLSHFVTFLSPDFFGNPATHNYFGSGFYHERVLWIGIPALLFIMYELVNWKRQSPVTKFFSIAGLVSLSLGFNLPTSWLLLYEMRLPFVSEMTPSRIFFLSSFCFSVVAALGLSRFEKDKDRKAILFSSLVLGLGFVVAWIWATVFRPTHPLYVNVPWRNLVIPTILFISTGGMICLKRRVSLGVLIVTIAGALLFAHKYLSFSERTFVFPETPVVEELQKRQGTDRFWSFGEGEIVRNFSNQLGLYSPEGYESFNISRYAQLVYSSHNKGVLPKTVARADVEIYKAKDLSDAMGDFYRRRILALVGVKYLVFKEDGVYQIRENPEALPRFSLYGDYVVEKNDERIIKLLYDEAFPIDKTLVLDKEPDGFVKTEKKGTAQLVSYLPNEVIIKSTSETNQLLFLSDNYYPGWKAFIDGIETKIYRADYTFRAVVVPAGDHKVQFVYQPESVKYGVWMSTVGLGLLFVTLIILRAGDRPG